MDSVSGVDTGDEESVNPFKFPELSWKSVGSHFSTDSLYFIDYMACWVSEQDKGSYLQCDPKKNL